MGSCCGKEREENRYYEKFIEKKKVDKKFKQAGQGYSLTGGESSASGAHASSSASPPKQQQGYKPPADTTNRRVVSSAAAEAASKRLQSEQPGMSAAQRRIREQARKELEEEERLRAAEQSKLSDDARDGVHEFEHSNQISTLLFTCDLFGDSKILTKSEMTKAVEEHLQKMMYEDPIKASLIMIHSLNSLEKREKAVELLLKCLKNILEEPDEEKYRQIRVSNKSFAEKIAPAKGGVEFLKAIGFVEKLQSNASGGNETMLILPEPDETQIRMIGEAWSLLEESADSYSYPLKLHRDPKVFKIDLSKPIPKPEISNDFFVLSSAELQKEQQQRSEDVDKLTTLRTSKMREADAKLQQKNYRYTLIRIRFPNEFVLQGVFSAHERFGNVRKFVKEKLANRLSDFTLKDPTLSNEQFVDDEKTIYEYGLVPTALLRFEWKDYVSDSMAQTGQQPLYLDAELEACAELM